MPFALGSKNRLTSHDVGRFPGTSLLDRLGRAVCAAECLPRKELFEAWELARRVRRKFRGGRVVDVAGGHGLLAHVLLVLDDSSAAAHVVDPAIPVSAERLAARLCETSPRLAGRVHGERLPLGDFTLESGDVIVASHACGALADDVLQRAVSVGARVAVMPCCHDAAACDVGAWRGWLDVDVAIDVQRVCALQQAGYDVWTQRIPEAVTPKNRVILAAPRA